MALNMNCKHQSIRWHMEYRRGFLEGGPENFNHDLKPQRLDEDAKRFSHYVTSVTILPY